MENTLPPFQSNKRSHKKNGKMLHPTPRMIISIFQGTILVSLLVKKKIILVKLYWYSNLSISSYHSNQTKPIVGPMALLLAKANPHLHWCYLWETDGTQITPYPKRKFHFKHDVQIDQNKTRCANNSNNTHADILLLISFFFWQLFYWLVNIWPLRTSNLIHWKNAIR